MDYISATEAAEKWGVTPRQAQRLLAAARVPGARKQGRDYLIPAGAKKPGDPRFEKHDPQDSLSSELAKIIEATTLPMPFDNPDAILDTVKEERLRLHYESELAYLRGDFERTKDCYRRTEGDEASRFRACSIAIAAALSTGDYPLYLEIETFLKNIIEADINVYITTGAEFTLNTAYVSTIAPNMVAGWLKDGDFSKLHPKVRLDAAEKRAKYFQCVRNYDAMLTVSQTALAFSNSIFFDIYLHTLCAIAYHELGRPDEANHHLSDALKIAMPHGFITPFAESVTLFGGLLEKILEREYPAYYDAIIGQWKHTRLNWVKCHNQFTKDNITHILSLQDYEIALMAAKRVPNKKIAERFHMSQGRLRNKISEIYRDLLISSRKELKTLVIWQKT